MRVRGHGHGPGKFIAELVDDVKCGLAKVGCKSGRRCPTWKPLGRVKSDERSVVHEKVGKLSIVESCCPSPSEKVVEGGSNGEDPG